MAKATAKKAAPTKKAAAPKATAAKKAAPKKAAVKKAAAPKKLRVAFIGCGGIFTTHMAAYSQIPEVEIVGYCDIKPDRLEYVQKQYGATPEMCFEKWDDMFKAVKPDAIDVCTPNGVHMPAAVAAANAGCHVMVEKPMAMTPEECEKMIAAAKINSIAACSSAFSLISAPLLFDSTFPANKRCWIFIVYRLLSNLAR